jgi:hypothetical protein
MAKCLRGCNQVGMIADAQPLLRYSWRIGSSKSLQSQCSWFGLYKTVPLAKVPTLQLEPLDHLCPVRFGDVEECALIVLSQSNPRQRPVNMRAGRCYSSERPFRHRGPIRTNLALYRRLNYLLKLRLQSRGIGEPVVPLVRRLHKRSPLCTVLPSS